MEFAHLDTHLDTKLDQGKYLDHLIRGKNHYGLGAPDIHAGQAVRDLLG